MSRSSAWPCFRPSCAGSLRLRGAWKPGLASAECAMCLASGKVYVPSTSEAPFLDQRYEDFWGAVENDAETRRAS
jgi:hypothetical protein